MQTTNILKRNIKSSKLCRQTDLMQVSSLVFAIWEMLDKLFSLSKLQLPYAPNGEEEGPYVTGRP